MVELSKPPSDPPTAGDQKYIHQEVLGRAGESPAEKTVREALNDHGRALQQMHGAGTGSAYPLDQDGDEDK